MYVSIVEYSIGNIDEVQWADACRELAPAFATVPGLVAKYWLRGQAAIRGGVYIWSDIAAYRAFLKSDVARTMGSHPNISHLTMRQYAVDEVPTQVTRGMLVARG